MQRLIAHVRRWRLTTALWLIAMGMLVSLLWPLTPDLFSGTSVVSTQVTDRDGGLLREASRDGRGRPVALSEVNPTAVQALVATEDRRFYVHPGVDPLALARALWSDLRAGTVVSGGSTLTMQVARALRGRSGSRWWDKLAEMHLALRLELHLTKKQILAAWLNRVPFGHQTHGIEAAARLYFGKPARDLTLAEATYLIGLPQSPSRLDPLRHPARARARQRRVLASLERDGTVSAAQRQHLEALPLPLARREGTFRAPHLVRRILQQLPTNEAVAEVRTTLDPAIQQDVAALMRAHVRLLRRAGVTNAAAIVLDNGSGDVLAYAGSADFWDDDAGGQNDGVQMLRQPGSALKPFTYAMALATRRYTPASVLPDVELHVPEAGGAFSPQNYDETFHGPVPLRVALASSYNVPAVRLARALGPATLLAGLHRAGFTSLDRPAETYGVGLTLGNGEVRLVELARAYAGLARGGSLPALRTIRWMRTARGDTAFVRPGTPQPMGIDPQTAYLITHILSDPEARAPGFGRGGPLELPFPTAVKTGTSKDYRDNWTVGYTPRYTVAVWAGNFDGSPMQWVSGVSGAGPLFKAIMLKLGTGGAFARPSGLVEATVCPQSGLHPGAFCPARHKALFLAGTAPADTCDVHRRYRLDRRTGLLADATTPANAVDERIYTVYPPLYHAWMQQHGLPLPPTVSQADVPTNDAALTYSDALHVSYPEPGTAFHIDPILRPAFQQVHLRSIIDPSLQGVTWWIDGTEVEGDRTSAAWTLEPGHHRIELRAVTRAGDGVRSRPVGVTVRR